jgi:ribonuclease P protein component
MLKREFRLTNNKDFQTIYRRGRYNSTALFSVNVLPNKSTATKVGVVVNKKVSKRAHERNLIKRQVREVVRAAHPRLKPGLGIVVTVKPKALGTDYKIIEKDILGSLKRLDLFNDK